MPLARVLGTPTAGWMIAALTLMGVEPAGAGVFHSRESALSLAFPDADRIEARDLVLTAEEAGRVADLARVRVESRLVTAYEGRNGDRLLGWAFLDTHTVRTLPETLLLVVSPDGTVRNTRLLAFHEPPQYAPPGGWLAGWPGRSLGPRLAVGREIDGISGATMTAHAVTGAIRRLLAVARVKLLDDVRPASAGAALP